MISHERIAATTRRISLRTVFIGFVSLAVLLTLAIAIFSSTKTQKQTLIENTLDMNHLSAIHMGNTIESLFQSIQTSLDYAASTLTEGGMPQEGELDSRLELIRNSSNFFNSMLVADHEGLIQGTSPQSVSIKGTYLSSEEALAALRAKSPFISKVYMTPNTGRIIVFISAPLFDAEGQYKGIIGGTVYLQEKNILNQIFGSQVANSGGSYFFIADSAGKLLYYPDKQYIGKDFSESAIVQKMKTSSEGKQQYTNLFGVESLGGYMKIPSTDWGVVTVSPESYLDEQVMGHVRKLLLNSLLPLLVLGAAVVWTADRLASPFVKLADLVQRFGKGRVELPRTEAHWNLEADLLTRTVVGALHNIREENDLLTREAATDMLTGMANRRIFELTLREWILQGKPFVLFLIDIDRFKAINDTYGHQKGDEVLRRVAETIRNEAGEGALSFRFGGEEFVVLLPEGEAEAAYRQGERVRLAVETCSMPVAQTVTVSVGIAQYPLHAPGAGDLFNLADRALYEAKGTGRNRTVAFHGQETA